MGSRHVPHPDSPLTCTAPQGKLGAGGLQGRTAQIQGRAFWSGECQNRASLQRVIQYNVFCCLLDSCYEI